MSDRVPGFKARLTSHEPIMGTFLKSPSAVVAEVLGLSSLDTVVLDTEHAPFGRVEADACIAALRAADMPSLVRTADDSPREIRNALDSGATGIVVPHVISGAQAEAIVKASHFGDGGRGFAGSPRAAGYGTRTMAEHLAASREETTVIVQIEDIPALDHTADIAAVEGVDAVFIGRADLAVAMGKSPMDDAVIDAVESICKTCRSTGTAVGMFTPDLGELPKWRELGASLFLLSSDQSFLLAGANSLAQSIR
jgi:2-keto-3-deoxy-L-rhamnonate aldolase RhmA